MNFCIYVRGSSLSYYDDPTYRLFTSLNAVADKQEISWDVFADYIWH